MFRCAIASPHEVATEAGAAAVRAGGNALDAALRDVARERGWQIRDFRTARKAARIGVPSALALGAVGGALAAMASRKGD